MEKSRYIGIVGIFYPPPAVPEKSTPGLSGTCEVRSLCVYTLGHGVLAIEKAVTTPLLLLIFQKVYLYILKNSFTILYWGLGTGREINTHGQSVICNNSL